MVFIFLSCPQCDKPIEKTENSSRCKNCGKKIISDEDYIDFIPEEDFYWGEIKRDEMSALLSQAKKDFFGAVYALEGRHPGIPRYIFSGSRAGWVYHCYSEKMNGRCLDLGSGYGTLSFSLSSLYNEVFSLEGVKERVSFQVLRKKNTKTGSVKIVRGNFNHPPFSDSSFDLIVCNGVLEWAGLYGEENPRVIQKKFLQLLKRKLKDDGCLYVGIENRFGFNFFLGGTDHTNMPFTSVMPRGIADFAVRHFKKFYDKGLVTGTNWKDYRTYTYGWPGYAKLLKEAGFENVEVYWCYPSYNFPIYSGKIGDGSLGMFLSSSAPNTKKILKKMLKSAVSLALPLPFTVNAAEFFWPEFLIYAYNGKKPETVEEKIIPKGSTFFTYNTASNEPKYFIGKAGSISFSRVLDLKREKIPEDALEAAKKYGNFAISERKVGGFFSYESEKISGDRFDIKNPSHRKALISWLINFQNNSKFTEKDAHIREFDSLAEYAKSSLDPGVLHKTLENLSELKEWHKKNGTFAVAEHGDLSSGNILVSEGKLIVLDWEFFKKHGNPFFDILFFVASRSDGGTLNKYSMELLADFAKESKIPEKILLKHLPYVCLRVMCRHDMRQGAHFHENFLVFSKKIETMLRIGSNEI